MVLASHCGHTLGAPANFGAPPFGLLFQFGRSGADIFFVLSGFVMCYISTTDSKQFLPKRLFRIVPLYWVATLAVFSVGLVAPELLNSSSANFRDLVQSLLFIPFLRAPHRIMPVLFLGWTLQYEVFFYLIFSLGLAVAAAVGRDRKNAHAIAIATAILLLILFAIAGRVLRPTSTILFFYTRPIILEFAFGAASFMLWSRYEASLRRMPWIVPVAVSLFAYGVLVSLDLHLLDRRSSALRAIPGFVIWGGLGFLLCLSFLSLESRFRFPALWLLIGDASYSLYLLHPYVFELLDKKVLPLKNLTPLTLAVALVGIALCCGLAILSFNRFELPVNKYLRRKFLAAKPSPAAAS